MTLLDIVDVSKAYGGLRPLRIERLQVADGDQVAILGFDEPSAETFINLVTGATLADRGEIAIFGRAAGAITEADDWLAMLDRFGIVTPRAVLLDGMTVIQNLAVPFTLDLDPPPPDVRVRAEALAREVGLAGDHWNAALATIPPAARARVRLGRAVALDPALLLVEHASKEVPRDEVRALGRAIRDVAARRGAALIAATADADFATAVADRVVTLDPATGRIADRRGWFR